MYINYYINKSTFIYVQPTQTTSIKYHLLFWRDSSFSNVFTNKKNNCYHFSKNKVENNWCFSVRS